MRHKCCKIETFFFLLIFSPILTFAQGTITGKVSVSLTNQPVASATVSLQPGDHTTLTDSAGNYRFGNLAAGLYQLKISAVGYREVNLFDIQVGTVIPIETDVSLETVATDLKAVTVAAPRFNKTIESPVSVRSIGATEIERNPGGNRDISKVIQSLPGVAVSTTFRNDIIIRGGSPTENRFYIDGIEIPNINHFSTQGASGGPVGLINVDLIKGVDFYSGAFPANRGNALSSIMEFHLKNGETDKQHFKLSLGSSDLAATAEGPAGPKTTYLASYRYSYLQDLFRWLQIPFLPAYQDFQLKLRTRFDEKNELELLGLGAIDRFTINPNVPNTEINAYTLATIPYNAQNNFTVGATFKHFAKHGYTLFVLSRDYLENIATKYTDNNKDSAQLLDYRSTETETKFRVEHITSFNYWRLAAEGGVERNSYATHTFNLLPYGNDNYVSSIGFYRYGGSVQLSRPFFQDKLALSAGVRADGANFSPSLQDLSRTVSPRFSASYSLTTAISINFNTGIYYQMPSYTLLGFKDSTGRFVNRGAGYISNRQLVLGLEWNTTNNSRFTLEGFYKLYPHYPLITTLGDTIPLADLGNSYVVTGNYPIAGDRPGQSYGVELLAQQRLNHGFYGIFALTVFTSRFEDKAGHYRPSDWDSRYIISMTGGKLLARHWQVGVKLRVTGGSPYTPYNIAASQEKNNYTLYPAGLPDYSQLNSLRLKGFYQADIRIDKKYLWQKFNLNFYLDVQNVTAFQYDLPPVLIPVRDASGNVQTVPGDPSRIQLKFLRNPGGNITPTIGVIFER